MRMSLVAAVAAVGLGVGTAQPALAATAPSSQCAQAKAAVASLYQLSDKYKTSNPALSKAYYNMAKSQERALAYYC